MRLSSLAWSLGRRAAAWGSAAERYLWPGLQLGRHADGVSEVDVSDLDDLKISWAVQGRAVTLLMGESNFSSRIENFLEHYPDIHRKMPQASTFDLRLDDRITGLEDPGRAR